MSRESLGPNGRSEFSRGENSVRRTIRTKPFLNFRSIWPKSGRFRFKSVHLMQKIMAFRPQKSTFNHSKPFYPTSKHYIKKIQPPVQKDYFVSKQCEYFGQKNQAAHHNCPQRSQEHRSGRKVFCPASQGVKTRRNKVSELLQRSVHRLHTEHQCDAKRHGHPFRPRQLKIKPGKNDYHSSDQMDTSIWLGCEQRNQTLAGITETGDSGSETHWKEVKMIDKGSPGGIKNFSGGYACKLRVHNYLCAPFAQDHVKVSGF